MRIFALVAGLASVAALADDTSADWRVLRNGQHCVGTESLSLSDAGRIAPTNDPSAVARGRMVTGRLWYPAACDGTPLAFWRYWGDDAGSATQSFVSSVLIRGGNEQLATLAAQRSLQTPMAGRAGATPTRERTPLVLFTGDAGEHALLAEFLASHRFAVATVAYQGTSTPDFAVSAAELETQVQDLQHVLATLLTRPYIDVAQLGLVCHAIGSTSCAMLAMRDPRIRSLVSLEGGFPSQFEQDLIRRSPYFEVAALRVPMLILHAPHPHIDPHQLDAYRFSRQLRVSLPLTAEYHMLSFGAIEPLAPGFLGREMPRSPQTLALAADIIVLFLRAELAGDRAAWDQLRDPPAGHDGVVGTWAWVDAVDARVAFADLQRLARTSGVAGIRAYCERVKCGAVADPEAFRRLAAWLGYQEPPLSSQALDFAQLRADTFPGSARARAALAFAAQDRGDHATFQQASTRALELLDSDTDPALDAATRERIRGEIERRSKL